MWLLVLPANTARSRRGATLLLSGDGAVCWNDAVNATAASRSTRAARQTIRTTWRVEPFMAARAGHISKKRRRTLDACWDVAAQEAGNSQAHPVNLG